MLPNEKSISLIASIGTSMFAPLTSCSRALLPGDHFEVMP